MTFIKLALQRMKRKINLTLTVFAVLTISFAFSVAILCYNASLISTSANYRLSAYGSWYGSILGGDDEDYEYLTELSGVTTVGTTVSYFGSEIGTISDEMKTLGIHTVDGRLPKRSGEIAVEADYLSVLGYDYELGQDIDIILYLTVENESGETEIYPLVRTFTLCGVISEYTSLWSVSSGSYLNSAIILPQDAEDMYEEAVANGAEVSKTTSYFVGVKDGYEDSVASELKSYNKQISRKSSRAMISYNTAYSTNEEEAEFNSYYTIVVFIVSLISVVVIYILQLQEDVKRCVRLRSVGATKGQLRLLVLCETILVAVPAMILGTAFGILALWVLLKLTISAGSVAISIVIPAARLAVALICWVSGTLIVRVMTIQVALFTPMTGRMTMQAGKARKAAAFQRAIAFAMPIVLCAAVVVTALRAIPYYWHIDTRENEISYYITDDFMTGAIDDAFISEIRAVPGIRDAWGYTELRAEIEINGEEIGEVTFYVVDETDSWYRCFDFSNVDLEAFNSGDCVIMSFPEDDTESEIPNAGEILTVVIGENELDTVIGDVNIYKLYGSIGYNYGTSIFLESYNVVCSRAFMQKIIDTIPDGESIFTPQNAEISNEDSAAISKVLVFANSAASYLDTDTVIAKKVKMSSALSLLNSRENYATQLQDLRQQVILILVSGGCIALVALIILVSTVKLETRREIRKYGILQALGMSRRQRNLKLAGTALLRAVISLAAGWIIYLGYVAATGGESNRLDDTSTVFKTISANFNNLYFYDGIGSKEMILLSVALFAAVLAICYISKLGLNRFSLMEMLSADK